MWLGSPCKTREHHQIWTAVWWHRTLHYSYAAFTGHSAAGVDGSRPAGSRSWRQWNQPRHRTQHLKLLHANLTFSFKIASIYLHKRHCAGYQKLTARGQWAGTRSPWKWSGPCSSLVVRSPDRFMTCFGRVMSFDYELTAGPLCILSWWPQVDSVWSGRPSQQSHHI